MTESGFELWTTDHLGDMIRRMRQAVRDAQARFEASEQEERRSRGKRFESRLYHVEQAELYARRLADELEAMQIELRRRNIVAVIESRVTL